MSESSGSGTLVHVGVRSKSYPSVLIRSAPYWGALCTIVRESCNDVQGRALLITKAPLGRPKLCASLDANLT